MNPLLRNPNRIVIVSVMPCVDGGRYPVKRVVGDEVRVDAIIIVDGHEMLNASVSYRHDADTAWTEIPLIAVGNDHWQASFQVTRVGWYTFQVEAWLGQGRQSLETPLRMWVDRARGVERLVRIFPALALLFRVARHAINRHTCTV